jgi:hypothetical protein
MMLVRVEGHEHFFCYNHISLRYARVTRPRDPHPKMVRPNKAAVPACSGLAVP